MSLVIDNLNDDKDLDDLDPREDQELDVEDKEIAVSESDTTSKEKVAIKDDTNNTPTTVSSLPSKEDLSILLKEILADAAFTEYLDSRLQLLYGEDVKRMDKIANEFKTLEQKAVKINSIWEAFSEEKFPRVIHEYIKKAFAKDLSDSLLKTYKKDFPKIDANAKKIFQTMQQNQNNLRDWSKNENYKILSPYQRSMKQIEYTMYAIIACAIGTIGCFIMILLK